MIYNETQNINLKELEREDDNIEGLTGEIRLRGLIQFVLLECPEVSEEWMIPTEQMFNDVINGVECNLLKYKPPFANVLKWSNLWGSVGLLGLSAKSLSLIHI